MRDVIDDLQVDHRSTSVLPIVHMILEQATDDRAGDQPNKEDGPLIGSRKRIIRRYSALYGETSKKAG